MKLWQRIVVFKGTYYSVGSSATAVLYGSKIEKYFYQ